MSIQQPMLFDPDEAVSADKPALSETAELAASHSLAQAMPAFRRFMHLQGFTENTINSFLGDMDLVMRRLGRRTPLGKIGTKDLNSFLGWLADEREAPCSPKSYARRVTTLKVFFGWLKDSDVLPQDPSARVVQLKARSPLPTILYEGQVEGVLQVTHDLMLGEADDPRPHLIVTLILNTGIKKSECMGIKPSHIDLSDPKHPVLWVRYENPRYRLKERKLKLPPDFPSTLSRYVDKYAPQSHLFACTPRNLEYVLKDVAQRANLPDGLSFEMLRWTCAVRDHRAGMDQDLLRRKLGLAPMTWRDAFEKIQRLAEPAL